MTKTKSHKINFVTQKLFFAFLCLLEHFESIETHFFFENVRERDAREQSERDASAKPEGAKRPSSPAGLAGRSAKQACKLVLTKYDTK